MTNKQDNHLTINSSESYPTGRQGHLKDIILSLRPNQWTKNIIVLAAFFFALWDKSRENPLSLSDLGTVFPAMLLFCIVSSGIYILNDIKDINVDRNHPIKKLRPIAGGRIPINTAWVLSIILLTVGSIGALILSVKFMTVIIFYIIIQLIYSIGLKQIALVDILVIATGFVLRAIAGAVVLDIYISPWLLLCTFLLALFLALCKRRHEKLMFDNTDNVNEYRPSLEKYDKQLLDQLIAIVSSSTIVCYAIYTLAPETVSKFGTSKLGLTIPFVMFGIFRYLDLVYRHDKGDRPEKILLTDMPLIANIALYGISIIIIFLLRT